MTGRFGQMHAAKTIRVARFLLAIVLTFSVHAENLADREVVIKWRTSLTRLDADELLPAFANRIERIRRALPVTARTPQGLERISVVMMLDSRAARELVSVLQDDPRIEYAELRPERCVDEWPVAPEFPSNRLDGIPNDPYYAQLWYLPVVEAESAWNITRGDPSVVVAVVDIGVDFTHPELTAARWENMAETSGQSGVDDDRNGFVDDLYGYDFLGLDGDPAPDPMEPLQSHGTHIAGTIAAARNNGLGISGIAPECRIMGVRAGQGRSIRYGYEGIYYACVAGARIVNCSWGGYGESAYEHDVLDFVVGQGCVVIASAGNENQSLPRYPAALGNTLGVAATQFGDRAAGFTNFGSWVKLAAPGVQILSCVVGPNGTHPYDLYQGTSMAAPVVAGVCALVASRFPRLNAQEIMSRVLSTCDPIDQVNPIKGGLLGAGRVNAWRALADAPEGVRLGEVTYSERRGDGDGRIRGGEQAELRISVFNDLNPFPDLYVVINTDDDSVGLVSSSSSYASVPVGGPYWNNSPPLIVQLAPEVGRGYVLPLKIDWLRANQRLAGRATVNVYLDSTFVSVDNGVLRFGFADNGCLGYYQYPQRRYLGPGFRISERTNALYHGSFVLAADEIVSDNGYGNDSLNRFDWLPVDDSVAHFIPSQRADLEATATFADRGGQLQLFARVHSSALAWRSPDSDRFIVLEYVVANTSVNMWNRTYAGFFFDFDVGAASSNLAEFDQDYGIACVRSTVFGHPWVGIASVTDSWQSYYVVDNRRVIDSLRWTDMLKWEVLENGIGITPTDPMDVSLFIASGPFAVPAHGQDTLAFALVVGNSMAELRDHVQRARDRYFGREPLTGGTGQTEISPRVYPNPLPSGQPLHFKYPIRETVTIEFFNVVGQHIARHVSTPDAGGLVSISPEVFRRASGVLVYRIHTTRGTVMGKLLLVK